MNNNCERRKKGKESEVKRRERKKELKKSFTRWTVTVYIYMVTVHLQDYCAYLDIFTKTDVRGFWVKMCKIEHFFCILTDCPWAAVVALIASKIRAVSHSSEGYKNLNTFMHLWLYYDNGFKKLVNILHDVSHLY